MTNATTRYFGLLDGERGAYGIVIPDLPGCMAMGKTVEEALRNVAEAAIEWADAVRESSAKPLPRPRSFEAVAADTDSKAALASGARWIVVPIIIDDAQPAKANLSLDRGLLRAIDEAAASKGLTRSAFMASAARQKIVAEG